MPHEALFVLLLVSLYFSPFSFLDWYVQHSLTTWSPPRCISSALTVTRCTHFFFLSFGLFCFFPSITVLHFFCISPCERRPFPPRRCAATVAWPRLFLLPRGPFHEGIPPLSSPASMSEFSFPMPVEAFCFAVAPIRPSLRSITVVLVFFPSIPSSYTVYVSDGCAVCVLVLVLSLGRDVGHQPAASWCGGRCLCVYVGPPSDIISGVLFSFCSILQGPTSLPVYIIKKKREKNLGAAVSAVCVGVRACACVSDDAAERMCGHDTTRCAKRSFLIFCASHTSHKGCTTRPANTDGATSLGRRGSVSAEGGRKMQRRYRFCAVHTSFPPPSSASTFFSHCILNFSSLFFVIRGRTSTSCFLVTLFFFHHGVPCVFI